MRFSPPASFINSTILSRSLRDALRAGEKTTTSRPKASERHAQNMAMLKVLPKRLGVEMSTSLLLVSHPFWRMIAGFSVSQSPL